MQKNTSVTLGSHFEQFISQQVQNGRYGSASEVVRDALRALEDHKTRLEALKAHLAEGAAESARKEYVEDFSVQKVVAASDEGG